MEASEFVASIDGFSGRRHVEKIKLFAWFLLRHKNQEAFTAADIARCFDTAKLASPSAIPPFLASLANRRPPLLLRRGAAYLLEQTVVDGLDTKHGQRPSAIYVDQLLTELPSRLPVTAEKAYLEEALICFRHKAFRAAIVMAWNLAYDHLCQCVLDRHLALFNSQLKLSYPKADVTAITKKEDFAELKEFQVLQVCKSATIISSSLFKILKEKLDRRNVAAHPSGIQMTQLTAEEVIRDLIDNVVLKL